MGILEARNLKKRYGKRDVVNGLNITLNKGEIVGLLGPNGAGKTTAFYIMMGLIKPDEGSVIFQGHDITKLPIDKRAHLGMGYLAQEPSVFRSLSVSDNILCILETLPISKGEQKTRLEQLLHELNLEHLANKKATSLSGGERRRVEITRALVTNPSLLLLDEPFANIDPISISEVQELIRLLSSKGITTLITDHNAREIFSVAQRSYLMRDGKILLYGTKEELINHPEARATYLGRDFQI